MARTPKGTPPKYTRHSSGKARVRIPLGAGKRKEVLLGEYGSSASYAEYERVLAEWRAMTGASNGANNPGISAEGSRPGKSNWEPASDLTMNELMLRYVEHAETYYRKNGKPTSEQDTIRQALRFVKHLYGHTLAREFGPLALKAVRQQMVEHPIARKAKVRDATTGKTEIVTRVLRIGLSRRLINKQIGRIKRMFSWAVENELIPPTVHQALASVKGLRKDKSAAREKDKVHPVSDEHVEAVLPMLPETVRTMIQVQRLCGGRPQDIVEMKSKAIDQTGTIWEYRPGRHKSEHHETDRVLFLGPRAQKLLTPFLNNIRPDDYVFSPLRSEMARLRAVPAKLQNRGKWNLRDHYDAGSYRRAVRRACKRANVPIWFPLQLRHSAGTEIRRRYGLEASQAVLGHAELGVTQVYAEVDRETARRVMAEIG